PSTERKDMVLAAGSTTLEPHAFATMETPRSKCMARGVGPRQPAKSGKQAGIRGSRPGAPRTSSRPRAARGGAPKTTRKGSAKKLVASRKQTGVPKGYNPTAPGRVQAILKHLDALYPEAVCALHHKNAWELLVATILSAQSTDANVNRVTPVL